MSAPTTLPADSIADRLAALRCRIRAAAEAAGRDPAGITLVAVSKTHTAAAVMEAIHAGQLSFGENRAQEAQAKFPQFRAGWPSLRLHLIGPLQTNKVPQAATLFDTIESVDRPRLADTLARHAERTGHLPELLIQVNVGNEVQKSGIPTDLADSFIAECRTRFGDRLRGLMAIPPAAEDPTPHFTWLARAAERHQLPTLSIGMSDDFEAAIAAGATHVRLGSAVFGMR